MAVVVTDRRTVVDEADTTTGWTGADAATTAFFAEATACVAAAFNNATGQVYFTGASRDLSNTLIYVYSFNNALQGNWDAANPPNALHIGDGTNRVSFRMAGANRRVFNHLDGPTEWQCLVLDGARAAAMNTAGLTTVRAGSFGALNLSAITQTGSDFTTQSKALGGGQNVAVDIIRVGNDGIRVTGGATGDRGNFLEIAVEDRSTASLKAHGLLRELGTGVYSAQGPFTLGGATETSWFEDIDMVLVFENRNIADDKYYIQVEGGTGETHVIIRNSTIKSAGPGVRCDFQVGGATTIDTLEITGVVFAALKNAITFGPNTAHVVTGCTFDGCGQIDASSVQFRNNTISNSTDPDGALLVGALGTAEMANLSFVSPGSGHAVRFMSPGTYSFSNWSFSGYGSSGTTDAAMVNDSGGLVTINVTSGDSPTVLNVGASTTEVQNVVSLTITGLVDDTEVRIYRVSDDVELFGVENSLGGSVTYEYNYLEPTPVYIHIHNIFYVFIRLELTLGANDASVPVQQRFDRAYSNPD